MSELAVGFGGGEVPAHLGLDIAVPPVLSDVATPQGEAQATSRTRSRAGSWLGSSHVLAMLLCADVAAAGTALLVAPHLVGARIPAHSAPPLARLACLPIYLAVMAGYGMYRGSRRRLIGSSFPDLPHLLHSVIVAGILTMVVSSLGAPHRLLPPIQAPEAAVTSALVLLAVFPARALGRRALAPAQAAASRVLVVGSGIVATKVVARLARLSDIEVVGWVDEAVYPGQGTELEGLPHLGSLQELPEVVDRAAVDHVIVAFSPAAGSTLAAVLRDLSGRVRISIVPRLFDLLSVRSHVEDLRGLPVVDVAPPSLGLVDRFAKRTLDIAVSALGLLLLSPLLVAIALAIKITSPGPVLYRQERTGRHRRPFRICKFRTMRVGSEVERTHLGNEVDGPLFKVRRDPRVTSVGRLLRTTSLDELPQLINVLTGEMSLVGPRPFVPWESEEIRGWAGRRYEVRPGMTGLWQVSGRSDLPFAELCRLDYSYVASWSLWWDLQILWQTPISVLRRHGAY